MLRQTYYNFFNINSKIIPHDKLSIIPTYRYDSWNDITDGQVKFDVSYNNTHVGYVDFRSFTGQVGFIHVNEPFRRQGIAKLILSRVEKNY